jgi:immune inhibitor A
LIFEKGEKCQPRHLHPSVYDKYNKTKYLLSKNVNPEEFRGRGGLDIKTYKSLKQRNKDLKLRTENLRGELRAKYGSLKAIPLSVGPCGKIKPIIGNKKALVLLTEFKDVKHSHDPSEFNKLLFSKDDGSSMRDYYLEASGNKLDITGQVNERWYTADKKIKHYVDEIPFNKQYTNAQKLVKETILKAKGDGMDFKSFARDGKIDILIIVFAGVGLDTKLNIKYIRPHQGRLTQPIEVQKGIWADKYCIVSELPFDDLGVYCHEVSHILGLPDLYDEGYSPVVGGWCLMAIGDHNNEGKTPSHPSAWCKIHLGWSEPKILDETPGLKEIPAIIRPDGVIYKIEIPGSEGGEYFLLENRQQKGFDRYIPGNGLLIWHVSEDRCVHQAPNSDPEHYFLTLKQADGKKELESDMTLLAQEDLEIKSPILYGDEGDAYPGKTINRNFNEQSVPNSDSYKGHKTMVSVNSISDSTDIMKAQIGLVKTSIKTNAELSEIEFIKKSKIMLEYLMRYLNSIKEDNSYDEGYDAGKQDIIDVLIKKQGLNAYKDGYQKGFRKGYKKAMKKF